MTLDGERGWQPCFSCGTNMSQGQYYRLSKWCIDRNGKLKVMSEEEAKKLVADEFGFSPDKIEIVDRVHRYVMKMNRGFKKIGEYKRQPLYADRCANYVRFNVRCAIDVWNYEMINGALKNYCNPAGPVL